MFLNLINSEIFEASSNQNKKYDFLSSWRNLFSKNFSVLSDIDHNPQFNDRLLEAILSASFYAKDPDIILSALFQISGVFFPLYLSSNKALKEKWLVPLKKGEIIAAHALSEESAGTDVLNMKTCAIKKNKSWVLNGEKRYICNAPLADLILVYARTNKKSEKRANNKSIICFLIESNKKSIEIEKNVKKIGLNKIPMSTIRFNNHLVNHNEELCTVAQGFNFIQISTTFERIIIPISFIGRMIKVYQTINSFEFKNKQFNIQKSEMLIDITQSFSLLRIALDQINFQKWDRNYIAIGCLLKSSLSDAYLRVVKKARFIDESENRKIFKNFSIEDEMNAALGSWIYSGPNDVLKSMLIQLCH